MATPAAGERWQLYSGRQLLVMRGARRSARARAGAYALNTCALLLANAQRLALSSVTGLLAITSVSLGTYAGFSAQTTNPGNTFATGTVQMTESFGTPNGGTGAFSFGTVPDLLPGETVAKYLDLTNTGTLEFDLTLDTTVTSGGSALDNAADTSKRLQLEVNRCPGTWSTTGGSVTCTLTKEQLYSGQIAPGAAIPLTASSPAGGVAAGSTARLELKVTLPSAATGTAGLGSTFSFQWTATNR